MCVCVCVCVCECVCAGRGEGNILSIFQVQSTPRSVPFPLLVLAIRLCRISLKHISLSDYLVNSTHEGQLDHTRRPPNRSAKVTPAAEHENPTPRGDATLPKPSKERYRQHQPRHAGHASFMSQIPHSDAQNYVEARVSCGL